MNITKKKLVYFGEYHDLYVQNNTFLFAVVFEHFRNICFEIYELDPASFLLNQDSHDKLL